MMQSNEQMQNMGAKELGAYLIPPRPLIAQNRATKQKRPLIGVPTWSDQSTTHGGVAICAMNQLYLRSIEAAGGLPILIPLNLDADGLSLIFDQLDGLFLAGGEDIGVDIPYGPYNSAAQNDRLSFNRDVTELMLTGWAIAEGVPILGICRGMQLINVASGGTLYQDLDEERPDLCKHNYFGPHFARDRMSHGIETARGTVLHDLLGAETVVNSLHHQGIDQVGNGLQVIAWSENGLPEAIESTSTESVLGVQWHPEALTDADSQQSGIFRHFVEMAIHINRIN